MKFNFLRPNELDKLLNLYRFSFKYLIRFRMLVLKAKDLETIT